MVFDDYLYAWIDFCGDPDMPLPQGAAYSDIGNNPKCILKYLNFCIFDVMETIAYFWRYHVQTLIMHMQMQVLNDQMVTPDIVGGDEGMT